LPGSSRIWLALAVAPLLLALQLQGLCAWLGPCLAARASAAVAPEVSPSCPAHAAAAPSQRWEAGECCAWLGPPPPAEAASTRASVPAAQAVAVPPRLASDAEIATRFCALEVELPRDRPGRGLLAELGVLRL
jgi:hypothetical protein